MMFQELPFEIVENNQASGETYDESACLVGPKKYYIPSLYKEHGLHIYNFQARQEDVYLTGFERTGTTLHAEMVWLIGNDLNYEKAKSKFLDDRFPHLDSCILKPTVGGPQGSSMTLDDLNKQTEQRFLKTHLPFSLLPPSIFKSGSKVIYIARNPKDVIVSCYHAFRFFFPYQKSKSFEQHLNIFKENQIMFAPYIEHVKEAWERRNDRNFLFLFYEDTIKNKRLNIKRVANFLEKTLDEAQIDGLCQHLDLKNFRQNRSVNLEHFKEMGIARKEEEFIRKGQPGGWRQYFIGSMVNDIDRWIEEGLRGTDLLFPDV